MRDPSADPPIAPKVYRGTEYGSNGVTVEAGPDNAYALAPIGRYCESFAWGYRGHGPHELAFAILADLVDTDIAERHHQDFCAQVIADLPQRTAWRLHEAVIRAWLDFMEGHPV